MTATSQTALTTRIQGVGVAGFKENTGPGISQLLHDMRDSTVATVDSVADLRTALAAGVSPATFHVRYHTTLGDGGGGTFNVVAIGSYVDNGGTIITGGTLAALRVYHGAIDAPWFGVQLGVDTDNTSALLAALAAACGLAPGSFAGSSGDTDFTVTRKTVPVRILGRCRVNSRITIRYRGVQLDGGGLGTEGGLGAMGSIECNHDDHGIVLDTGTSTTFAPSLSCNGLRVTRSSGHQSVSLDGIVLDGTHWFKGLRLTGCRIDSHRDGLSATAAFLGGAGYASQLILDGCTYLSFNRNLGINMPFYWDLSRIDHISAFQNGNGGCVIYGRAIAISGIDLEGGGGGAENVFSVKGGTLSNLYFEQNYPADSPLVTMAQSVDATVSGINVSGTPAHAFETKLTSCINTTVLGQAPVLHDLSVDCNTPGGWFAPQTAAQGFGICVHHPMTQPNLVALMSLATLSGVSLFEDGTYTDTFNFGAGDMAALPVGTVGVPTFGVGCFYNYSFLAGHTYMVACVVGYSRFDSAQTADLLANIYYPAAGGTNSVEHITYELQRVRNSPIRQKVILFRPSADLVGINFRVYPYGTNTGHTGYGAYVSPIFTAEVTGTYIPQVSIAHLIAGYTPP